jgi:pimeloyl-ACP methyl ester carboxylesterase
VHALDTGAPVSFECEGFKLVGSLHAADGRAAHGVILLNQGPIDRGGSHRLYIKLANELTAMGVPVLRFDARGVGDSDGMWESEAQETGLSILEAYGHIQRGVWKSDALAAIEFMLRTTGVSRIVLGGLCGGATTAVFAGVDHPAVDGMFLIGTPITFSSVTRRTADLPTAIIDRDSAAYRRKLFQLSSWSRFLRMETDYRTMAHVLMVQLQRRVGRLNGDTSTPADDDSNVNVPLIKSIMAACKRRKRLLFVYGENDYLWQEFQEHLSRFGSDRSRLPFELQTIPKANHILTEESWQQALFTSVCDWYSRLTAGQAQRHLA